MAEAEGVDQAALLRDPDRAIDSARFSGMVARRAGREPLAYILGWQEFWSLRFAVSPATLIPRADSETVVEAALAARPGGVARVLDLGTGTGCLLLAVLTEWKGAFGVGVDRSWEAASLAASNAAALGLAGRSGFVCGDWASAIGGTFEVVLGNPPYIGHGEIASLMPEVARFEPASALDGGADGLGCYRAIMGALPRLLAPGGVALLEIGIGQNEVVTEMARAAGFGAASTRRDLGGIERVALVARG